MEDKQLHIVTFEQAKKLKKLGFDWKADAFWYNMFGNPCLKNILAIKDYSEELCFSAPTVALALKWFRDEKGIPCWIVNPYEEYVSGDEFYYQGSYVLLDKNGDPIYSKYSDSIFNYVEEFVSPESAESALLDELLNLESKYEHNNK